MNATFEHSLIIMNGPRDWMRSFSLALHFQPVLLVSTGEATEMYIRLMKFSLRLHSMAEATATQDIVRLLEDAEAEVIVIQPLAEMVVDERLKLRR